MATYTITLDERTNTGKALKEYLQSLGVLVKKISSGTKDDEEQEDVSASEPDTLTKEELIAIQKGLDDIKNGKTTKIKDVNNIWESIL